ncbi:hypothetical protein [Geothrix edaphica]|nr:hypothetical protein [Geothrix edaphica]
MNAATEHALTVDGSPVLYTIPEEIKGRYRSFYNDTFIKQLTKNTVKKYRPRFNFWSSRDPIVIADFDAKHLPASFQSWEKFREHLRDRFKGVGFVVPSPSGYAKVFFKVRMPVGLQMNVKIAHATLRTLLEGTGWEFDTESSACQYCFMDEPMYSLFARGRVFDGLELVSPSQPEVTANEAKKAWTVYELPKPAIEAIQEAFLLSTIRSPAIKEVMWFLVRWVCSSPKRAMESIGIAQMAVIASAEASLGAKFPQKNVSLALSALKNIGLLEVVDETYIIGQRSKLYRVKGDLELICAGLFATFGNKDIKLPDSVEDGTWHHTLLEVIPQFYRRGKDYQGLKDWFMALPGSDLGDRCGQMKSIWEWFERKWGQEDS